MPFSNGSYTAPVSSWNPAVAATTINATDWAALLADVSAALSLCVLKDGTQAITANIPMGGHKLTGLPAGSANGDSVQWQQTLAGLASAKGDLLVATAANAVARHGVGADNTLLGFDSTQSDGLRSFSLTSPLSASAGAISWTLGNQSANQVYAGPASGAAAAAAFRALVLADLAGLPSVAGTPIATTSGTTASFTSLPSWIKRIVFMLKDVSTNGTSSYMIQLSQSATFKTTGYEGGAVASGASSTAAAGAGLPITVNALAANTYKGSVTLTRESSANNTWIYTSGILSESGTNSISDDYRGNGYVSLSGTLDGIRLTTVSGDTFDAGEVNIVYS